MSDENDPAWWKFWNWPWSVWGLLAVVLLAVVPFAVRACFLASVPEMPEPFDVAAFVGDAIPPAENAFTEYRLACEMRRQLMQALEQRSAVEPSNYDEIDKGGWEAADKPMRAWLEEHRAALAIWRRGTEKQRALDHSPVNLTFSTLLNEILEMRAFARLARIDQMRCLHESDVEEAWKLARATYRSGGHVSRRGPMIQGLVGFALHNVASSGMQRWAEHPAVTAEHLRTALAQVKADVALFESESNTLKAEYLVLRNTMTRPGWDGEIGDTLGGPLSDGLMPAPVARGFLWMVGEPELTVRFARQIVANQIREVDQPLSERRQRVGSGFATLYDTDPTVRRALGELDANQLDRAVKMSILAKLLLPATNQFDIAVLRFRGRQAALEVMLAAQAYRRDKGEFPESLDQLVPQYLETVPLDPCDRNGGRLLYRRDSAASALVWSVAEDGTDNDGTIESEQGRPADVGFELK